ncbi:MAG: zinc-finger domain-containing protein [Rhodospirillaceae bacterium]
MADVGEIIKSDSTQVKCDGGGGALGHPRVYLHIEPQVGEIECPYCSRRYVLNKDAADHHGH